MILMNDFKKEYLEQQKNLLKTIDRCLRNGHYILGKNVEAFEKNFAKFVGTKYCVGVGNGLEALQISLMALGIGKGDEVITVANTAVATVLAITNVGATPVFVDVDDYYHLDVSLIEKAISNRTKAIVPVHLFGQLIDIDSVMKFAKKYHLYVIEDACQAHGAQLNGKMAGSFGTFGCFSFYPTKNLGAYGDAGALTTDSEELYKKCLILRNYGQVNRYHHEVKGINSRLDELQAAILNFKLKKLSKAVVRRNFIASLYLNTLKNIKEIALPKIRKENLHSFHLFVIRVKEREKLQEFLKLNKIETLVHYPIPVHKQHCYPTYHQIVLPKTEKYADEILSLPINPTMKNSDVLKICSVISSFYQKGRKV